MSPSEPDPAMPERDLLAMPRWARTVAAPGDAYPDHEAALDAAIELATASAEHGGGPFGAIITTGEREVLAIGWNNVIESHDSTAHAEIHAIRRAQARLATHDLAATEHGQLTLYGSCAPCIQCFGAIYWSGLSAVLTAAPAEAAEALGFMEGPVTDALWEQAADEKAILFQGEAGSSLDPGMPFDTYRALGGEIY